MLTITNTDHSFSVDTKQAIDLELKLNVTSKGKVWIHIGDHLFAYGTSKQCEPTLVVNNEQYALLQTLRTRNSYNDCYDL